MLVRVAKLLGSSHAAEFIPGEFAAAEVQG